MIDLVVLPGLDGTGARIAEFVRTMAQTVDVRLVTYPLDVPLRYGELEALVRAALPADRRFILLGESFSGPLAIRIAADPPPGLAGVILCSTFAKNPFPWARPARALAVRLPIKSLPRWLRAPLSWNSLNPRASPPRSQRALSAVADAVVRCRIGEILDVDESECLARIELPVLVLFALRDRILPRASTRVLLRALRRAEVAEIDGPHLLLQSRPAECAVPILRFLHRWN